MVVSVGCILAPIASGICSFLLPELHPVIRREREEARKAAAARKAPPAPRDAGGLFLLTNRPGEDLPMLELQAKNLRSSISRRRRASTASSRNERAIIARYEQLLAGLEATIQRLRREPDAAPEEPDKIPVTCVSPDAATAVPESGSSPRSPIHSSASELTWEAASVVDRDVSSPEAAPSDGPVGASTPSSCVSLGPRLSDGAVPFRGRPRARSQTVFFDDEDMSGWTCRRMSM